MARKGQTATEYLIILAVVIIIALIVVGVMGGIPGIGAGGKSKASQAYWSTAEIAFTSYSVAGTDATVNVRNNKPTSVTLTSVSLGTVALATVPVTLNAGQTATLTGTVAACSGSYSYAVTIVYTDVETGAAYTFTGDGQKLEGTCANAP